MQPSAVAAAEPGTIYTCPMHPQIRRAAPGNCPICGMALEPVMPSLEDEKNPELEDFSRRFRWTLPFSVVGVVLAMGGHRFLPVAATTMSWIELVLATPVVLWAGWPFFVRCADSIRHRSPNMWTLIGIGVAAAYVYSVLATVAPGIFPEQFKEMGRVAVYFEAAAVIVSLTLLGQILELRARSRTSAAIKSLLGLQAKTARRIRSDGTEEDIPLTDVHTGDVLRVRPGEKVPVDGVVVEGRVFVRSWSLKERSWHRTFLAEPRGVIQVRDREIAVRAVQTRSDRLKEAIDRAYLEKYHTPGSIKYAQDLGSEKSRATTTELVPL